MKFRQLVCKVPKDQVENFFTWCLPISFPVLSRRYGEVRQRKIQSLSMRPPKPQSLAFFICFLWGFFVFLSERLNRFCVGIFYMYLPNWPQYGGFHASWKLEEEISVLDKNKKAMCSACCWQILCDFSNALRVMLELLLLVATSDICHASQESPWPSSEKFLTDLESSAIQIEAPALSDIFLSKRLWWNSCLWK